MILSDMEIIDKVGRGEIGYHCEEEKAVEAGQHPLLPGKRYLGHTKETIELPDNIATQLVFFKLGIPSSGYDGKYQGQQGATRPR